VSLLALMAALAGKPATLFAQSPAERLQHPTSVSCTFSIVATGAWIAGQPKIDVKPARLSIAFKAVNVDDGSAEIVNGTGTEDIVVRQAEGILNLMQSFRQGPLYATTIFPKETHDGRLQAVHSRHEFTAIAIPGFTSQPEHYYGDCEVH